MLQKITSDVYYVGASDRRLAQFENLFPIPRGVSYNAYVLLDEKTALIDTADAGVGAQFLAQVEDALGGRALDYLVIQHMEPDHAAMINDVLTRHPQAQVVLSPRAVPMLAAFTGCDYSARSTVAKDGDTLCLGRHTLTFVHAPMVHWPEVMMTYDAADRVLFSADAFGTFGALSGNLFADEVDFMREFLPDARRYYANIVGKYGTQVQAVLKKAAALDIAMIAPLHGPIWRQDLAALLRLYDLWSRWQPEEKAVVIAYASMYGHTRQAAETLAALIAARGVTNIRMYDVSVTDVSEVIAEIFRAGTIALCSPTYNGDLYPAMRALLDDMKALGVRERTVGLIENGSWASAAGRKMTEALAEMKNMHVAEPMVTLRSRLTEAQLGELDALAAQLAESVTQA